MIISASGLDGDFSISHPIAWAFNPVTGVNKHVEYDVDSRWLPAASIAEGV